MGLLRNDASNNETTATSNSSSVSSSGAFNAVLDRGSDFEGKLTFEGTVRIDGIFKGEIFSSSHLVVGETGKIEADVTVESISISGEVIGDVKAKGKIELHSSAVVRGNIETPKLVIEEGAVVQGQLNMDAMTSATAGQAPKVGISKESASKKPESSATEAQV